MKHTLHASKKFLFFPGKVLLHSIFILSFLLSALAPINARANSSSTSRQTNVPRHFDLISNQSMKASVNEGHSSKISSNISSLLNIFLTPEYYYAASVYDYGEIGNLGDYHAEWQSPSNAIGPQDGLEAIVTNSSDGGHACLVVSLGSMFYLENGMVEAYVYQPQTWFEDMPISLSVSANPKGCNQSGWSVVISYNDGVGGPDSGGAGWYGSSYTGDVQFIKIEIWSNSNMLHYRRTLDIDSIRISGINISPSLLDRSSLSFNQPKNGSSDSRECAINGCSNNNATVGDPIDARTGNFDYSLVDLTLQTIAGPLSFQRSYASLGTDTNLYPTDMAPGWTHNQDSRLIVDGDTVWFKAHTLNQYQFTYNVDQTYTPYPGVLASLSHDSESGIYTLTASDQSVYNFDSTGRLQSWRNEIGFGFNYSYSDDTLYRVTEPISGRYLQFNYLNNRLSSVNDNTNRQISFGYDANSDLSFFTDVRGKTWTYEYGGASHHLQILKDPSAPVKTILSVHYDAQGRADEQFSGKGERIAKIVYNPDGTRTLLDAFDRQGTTGYDLRNSVAYETDFSGKTIQKFYDLNFRPINIKEQNIPGMAMTWSNDGAVPTVVQDAAGYTTIFGYDTQNHLTQIKDPNYQESDPDNHVIDNIYNGPLLDHITRHTNQWGDITTTYTYTTASDAPQPVGLLKTITDDLGYVTTFTYDSIGQLSLIEDTDHNQTHFDYDDLGRVTDVTNPLERITHYEYDEANNIKKVIQNYDLEKEQNDENLYNLTDEFFYDDQGRLHQTINTLGFTTTYNYDDAGRIYQVVDTYGKITTYLYNIAGQIESTSDPLGHSTGYEYDNAGRLWKVKDALNQVVLTYTYNQDSTVHTETRPTPKGNYVITYETYDALKRPTKVSDNEGHQYQVLYDAYGNPLTQTDAFGRVKKYEYNDLGLLAVVIENFKDPLPGDDPNATNVRTEYYYDELGNLKKIIDAKGNETTFDYDALNRLSTVTDPLDHSTIYTYDELGNRHTLTDANQNTTTLNYDPANRLQTIDYPAGMADVVYGYDALGRLTGMDDGLGQTTWAYDNLNRITSITDPFNKIVGYGYDDDSKRTSITYPNPVSKTITYQYNTLDQLEHVLDGSSPLADYGYDVAGRLNSVALANGVTSTPDYDKSGQLSGLTYQKGTDQYASYIYHYDLVGNRDQVQENLYYPHFTFVPIVLNEDGGGESLAMEVPPTDPDSQPDLPAYPAPGTESFLIPGNDVIDPTPSPVPYPAPGATTSSNSTSIFQQIWDFLTGLFTGQTSTVSVNNELNDAYPAPETEDDPPSSALTIDYDYDALNRLTSAVYSDGHTYTYEYDKVGNRSSQIVDGETIDYHYDAANRIEDVDGVSFAWDNNGNLLNDGAYSYTYDYADRLLTASDEQSAFIYAYDGLGNRYQQTVDGQTTTYILDQAADLSQVLYDGSFSYYYGLGRISQQKDGIANYILADALGSVRQLTDQSGSVIYGQAFDPFGNLTGQTGLGGSSYGFVGEWTDASGLQYLRARLYSPIQGRFTTKDPYFGSINNPATLNPYLYAVNNPVLYSDPSGKFIPFLAIAAIGFAAGAIYDAYQQTNGFANFCNYDILETLAWGVGGAAAATTATLMAISGVGFIGMGLQGAALSLSSIGVSSAFSTSLWWAGASAITWSGTALAWLFTSPSQIDKVKQMLSEAARRAQQTVGNGTGPVYGTRVHTAFAQEVRDLGRPDLFSEVSYLSNQPVDRGIPGSIRVDVVYGPRENPIAVFDLKTGTASLTQMRIQQIQSQLPHPTIPVIKVRP